MADQEKNAGNDGDIVKHATLAWVLNNCEWENVNYRETHAGNGIQINPTTGTKENPNPKPHINKLKQKIDALKTNPNNSISYYYIEYLKNWWIRNQPHEYPGSCIQAAEILKKCGKSYSIKATDTNYLALVGLIKSCHKLQIAEDNYHILEDSFSNQIPWLIKDKNKPLDNLVLLIDPFKLVEPTGCFESETAGGGISPTNILNILDNFIKTNNVVGLWLTIDNMKKNLHEYLDELLVSFCHRYKVTVRSFKKGNYRISWFGFGNSSDWINKFPTFPKSSTVKKNDPLELWEEKPTYLCPPVSTNSSQTSPPSSMGSSQGQGSISQNASDSDSDQSTETGEVNQQDGNPTKE